MGRGGRLGRLASQVCAAVSARVCLQARRKQRAGRLLSTDAPGLTPPPGAHWPAPHPPACEVQGVAGELGVVEVVVCRLPPAPGLASSQRRRCLSAGQTRLGGRWTRGGRGQAGDAARSAPGVTDSRGSRRARILRAHTHTPRCRDPRPPTAGGQTDAETRARCARLGTRALHPPAARGADSPPRAIPAESARADLQPQAPRRGPSGSR